VASGLAAGLIISFVVRDQDETVQTQPELVTEDAEVLPPQILAPQILQAPSSTRSAELSPSLGGVSRIQDIDLTKVPEVVAVAESTGGLIATKTAQFADLTGDGHDEALVSVVSGGSFGNLAYFVVALDEGWPHVIRQETADPSSRHGVDVQIQDASIVETSGIYGPDEPNCCPSLLKKTYYRWDGQGFQENTTEVVLNGGRQE
jgi:hypothetical protein